MAIMWPAELPQSPNVDGWNRTAQNQLWTFTPDAGPDFARPAGRKGFTETASFVLTFAELALFEEFFHETLSMGALAFSMTDPITRQDRLVRFAPGGEPYSYAMHGVSHVLVTCQFEEMPA